MRPVRAVVALLLLGAALALLAPATLADGRLADWSNGALRLAQARGTVWNGHGDVADAAGRWRLPVAWRVDPLALAGGRLALWLLPRPGSAAQGRVDFGGDGVSLRDVDLAVSAAALASAWSGPSAPQLTGEVHLRSPALRLDHDGLDGRFDADWDGAAVTLGTLQLDLGTVEAHGRPAAGGIDVALRSRGGEAVLAGTVAVRRNRVALDATLTPSPSMPAARAAQLRALGGPARDGAVRLRWQGP